MDHKKSNHHKRSISHLLSAILFFMIFFIFIGWADTWESIRPKSRSIETIRADFIQEKHLKILSKPLISRGSLYFKAPRSLRWEYESPVPSVLLMHNGQINRFVKSGEGFSRDSGMKLQVMQVVMDEITLWISGRFQDNPNFNAILEPGPKIIMTPKENTLTPIISHIELTLSDRPGIINTVTKFENEDSSTKLIFKDAILNEPLNDSFFESIFSNVH
jgi:outer membrane lipoprotein-sorting protein